MRTKFYTMIAMIALTLIMSVSSSVHAQDKKAPRDKKDALLELFEIIDYKGQMLKISESMTEQVKQQSEKMMGRMMKSSSLSDEEKEYIETEFMPEYVRKMTDAITTIFKNDEIITNILMPVYAKQFTGEEVKQLISFYKTPVGKKVVKTMPEITQEVMGALLTEYGPQIQEAVKNVTLGMMKKFQEKFGRQIIPE